MENNLTIMYVHGLNSSGNSSTAKNIETVLTHNFPDVNITIKHPTFSKNANDAIKLLKKEAEDCDIVIGTSLGGFLALNAEGAYRIVVNPALHPSITLPKLGESKEISDSYKNAEKKLISSVDFEDKVTVIGYFADKDEVVNDKEEFSKIYGKKATKSFSGKHRMDKQNIEDIIVPEVKKYIKMCESNYFDSFNALPGSSKKQ